MPDRLIVHAIQAADLTRGLGLTPLVAAAVSYRGPCHPGRYPRFLGRGTRISNSPVSSATPGSTTKCIGPQR
jgi:hypothetical protein